MKNLYLLFGFLALAFTSQAQSVAPIERTVATPSSNVITPEQVAQRMCDCAKEKGVIEIAQRFQNASDDTEKLNIKGELSVASRQMHICMDLGQIQTDVRNLPDAQRSGFESNVESKAMELCPELVTAMQNLR